MSHYPAHRSSKILSRNKGHNHSKEHQYQTLAYVATKSPYKRNSKGVTNTAIGCVRTLTGNHGWKNAQATPKALVTHTQPGHTQKLNKP